ncbi:DNA polymerase III subunit delta' [Pectinatus cerevisiiphilus]|uniref:DNA polymerase-3 subunit delta n=1 Tax=Pectinatus cerevisiiphilus TaxID=86956 RepID=A0A4V2URC0_9FIRM|nr:DNA polymerase III subunit delta' [Pectinatus cerevisiiphilus]TCS76167.1 DNA polymerase-3 subunit delta' [Pectinatus cerevisiiphilus]
MLTKWCDIKGHDQIIASLKRMAAEDRLPHAILFSGMAGVGKFLTGVALASMLLCEKEDGPCGSCPSCTALQNGVHPDFFLLEPEGKTVQMIKIDQIRQMQKAISLAAYMSDKRVVLIRNADKMNEAASNGLLKTLEEPVGNVFFILTADNEKKLLPTVISRCMRIYFAPLADADISNIIAARGITGADGGAVLAKLAGGSVEQALALYENDGLANRRAAFEFLTKVFSMTDEGIWTLADQLAVSGKEKFAEWLLYLQLFWRDIAALDSSLDCTELYNNDMKDALIAIKEKWNINAVFTACTYAGEIQRRLLTNADVRLMAEKFIISLLALK